MVANFKLYFAAVFVFIMSILYMLAPKAKILPLGVVALILVFLWAYLMQFAQS